MSEKKTEQSPNSKVSEISNQTKKTSVIEPDKKGNSANQEGVSSTSSRGVNLTPTSDVPNSGNTIVPEKRGTNNVTDGLSDVSDIENFNQIIIPDQPKEEEPFETKPSNIDSDGDGLTDETEEKIGLDPNNIDTDGNGIIDSEYRYPQCKSPKPRNGTTKYRRTPKCWIANGWYTNRCDSC